MNTPCGRPPPSLRHGFVPTRTHMIRKRNETEGIKSADTLIFHYTFAASSRREKRPGEEDAVTRGRK
jgi:hypothetical protein